MALSRRMILYLLGNRRAEAKAKRERDDLVDRFEAIKEATRAELPGIAF
jgi:hypothetical protein